MPRIRHAHQSPRQVACSTQAIVLPMLLIAFCVQQVAMGQSESQINQQQARHSQQIADLEAEITALGQRVIELEDLIRSLHGRLDSLESGDTDGPAETGTTDTQNASEVVPAPSTKPENPLQDPAAFLTTLRWSFDNELMTDPSFALGAQSADPRAQEEAAAILDAWVERLNRLYAKPITWSIQVLEVETRADKDPLYTMQALNKAGSEAGEPFQLQLRGRIARRVEAWRSKPDLARLLLKGTLEPNLTVVESMHPGRTINTEVHFDTKREEVSPYVWFDFRVRVSSVLPLFEENLPQPAKKEATNDGP